MGQCDKMAVLTFFESRYTEQLIYEGFRLNHEKSILKKFNF